jgi:hypothetical protein
LIGRQLTTGIPPFFFHFSDQLALVLFENKAETTTSAIRKQAFTWILGLIGETKLLFMPRVRLSRHARIDCCEQNATPKNAQSGAV